jgi:hypothetical protein
LLPFKGKLFKTQSINQVICEECRRTKRHSRFVFKQEKSKTMAKESPIDILYRAINKDNDFPLFRRVWDEAEAKAKRWWSLTEPPNPNMLFKHPLPDMPAFGFLHIASMSGISEFTEFLLKKGADVNIEDGGDGWTPLHWAVFRHHPEMVKLLIENGARVDVVDKRGRTPMSIAKDLGGEENEKIKKFLQCFGAA